MHPVRITIFKLQQNYDSEKLLKQDSFIGDVKRQVGNGLKQLLFVYECPNLKDLNHEI